MFRVSCIYFATVSKGKAATSPAKRKSKWIDRRRKVPPHNGREVYLYGQLPSCTLCHVKFKFKQDYATHLESDLHKNRVRWAEMVKWWNTQGAQSLAKHEEDDWRDFRDKVIVPEAEAKGIDAVVLEKQLYRTAKITSDFVYHPVIQYPITRPDIVEPRDNRWPYSPKW